MHNLVKKGVSIAVTTTTILWSVGAGFAPLAVSAASAGDLIKMDGNPAVYYLGDDNKRYVFPNSTTYFTWYEDFSSVVTVSSTELQSYNIGGNVTMRAGTKLAKITTDPKVYAVEPGGSLRWVENESVATTLYGADWAQRVVDVPDAFFVNYTVGSSISTNEYPTGSLIQQSGSTDVYYVDGSTKRLVDTAGMSGNNFQTQYVVTADDTVFNALTTGTPITGPDSAIFNVAGAASAAGSTGGTGLTVAVASDTPASGIHASGTAYNPALKLNLTASADGPVDVTSLTLTRSGVSIDSNIAGVGVFDQNGVRHGNFVTFSETKATINLANDPITVPAGQTIGVTVKTNITAHTGAATPASAPASGTYSLAVVSSDDVGTTASVTGSFPAAGNGFSYISGYNIVGSLTLDAVLVHTNGNNDATAVNVNLGTTDQVIGKFRLVAGSPEDIKVNSVTIYNNGNSNDGDITNIDLVAPDGTILGTVAQTTNRYATFDLSDNPYVIAKGNTRDLTIRADITGGSTRTVRYLVFNDYDIKAVGVDTGSGILPTAAGTVDGAFPIGDTSGGNASCTTSVPCINKITVAAGTLLFAKASDTPSGNIAAGANNVVFGKWDITAQGEDQELQQIDYTPTYSSSTLTGTVYFKINGTTVYSVASGSLGTSGSAKGTTSLSSYYTLRQGEKATFTVEGSIISTASAGSTVKIALDLRTVKRLATNDITDPGVTLTSSNTLTVSTASLSVAKNSSFSNTTVVAGQAGAKVGSFNLTASSTEPIVVSSLTVGLTNTTGVSNLMLKNGSTQIGSTITGPSSSNVFSISNLTIPAGTSTSIDVYLTTNSNATNTEITSLTAVSATGGNSSVTVTATGLTATGQTVTFSTGGTLTIASDSSNNPVAQILHSGLVDQTLLASRLTANNAEDIKITTIQVVATSGATTLQNLKLYYNGSQIGNTTQLNNGTASFSGLALTVPQDTSITIYVKGSTTSSGTIESQAVVNLAIDYVQALGVSGGATLKPGTTLNTTWTATNTSETGASVTVGSTVGFHVGDVVLVYDDTNAGQLGMVTVEPTSTTSMTVATRSAAVTNNSGSIHKIETGATTAASAGTPTIGGAAVTVTSTNGFQVGDAVLVFGASGVELGFVSAIGSSTSMTIKTLATGNTGAASRVSKIGSDTLLTTSTTGATTATTGTAEVVASTSGFNVGDLVLVHDSANTGQPGIVTAVASSTSMTVATFAAVTATSTTSLTFVRVGSTNPATTLITTSASAGARVIAGQSTTVTSSVGFGAGDVVMTNGATNGPAFGKVSTVGSSTAITIGSIEALGDAATRVTRLPGAAAAGNLLTIHDVEPTITLNSASPSGSTTAGSGQTVAIFDVKADGDRNMSVTSVNIQASGSNLPWNYVTNYDLYNGATLLASATPLNVATVAETATNALTGTTIKLCTADDTATGELRLANAAAVTAAGNKIAVNDKIVLFKDASNYITATVTAKSVGSSCTTGAATDVTLTVSNSSTTGTAPNGNTITAVKSFNVIFDGNSTTPLSSQTITAGATLPLTVKADTTSVKTTVTSGSVNYSVKINGTTGASNGGLTWGYTPSGGSAISGLTLSDSYPVNGGTLVY